MSRIPKNAIPHAEAGEDVDLRNPETTEAAGEGEAVGESPSAFSQLAGKVRENPGIAAAGAAAVVGIAAAAAIPAIRGRGKSKGKSKGGKKS